jgi:isopentenyldiphosphate isomerase
MDKVIAPGAFDIPCAGHVSGAESPEEALRHELGDELGLAFDDLDGLRLIAEHAAPAHPLPGTFLINPEYCYLYRAQIKPAALRSIRFRDGEVAGLALVNLDEMRALARRFPERVASGLSESLLYFL